MLSRLNNKTIKSNKLYVISNRRFADNLFIATTNNYYNEYWDRGKKAQWDGGEDVTDKDRHRELYFDWAETTNRSVHASRFGNVGGARRKYKFLSHGEQLEFQRIMRSICQGNYMNLTEEQMRAAYLGNVFCLFHVLKLA